VIFQTLLNIILFGEHLNFKILYCIVGALMTLSLWHDFEISRHFCQGRGKLIQVHHVAVWLKVKFQCGAKKVLSYYCQTEFLIMITHLQ
jgi:hypothetical protein